MTSCKEFELDDLVVITAIPVADFRPGTYTWQLKPTIPSALFSPSLANVIVIGTVPATTGGTLIPIKRNTGKAKDSVSDSVAGRLHKVAVSCEVDDRDGDVWDDLAALEKTPCHLLLTFRGGARAFALATKYTYGCEVERDGAKTSVSFDIQNMMGMQLIQD